MNAAIFLMAWAAVAAPRPVIAPRPAWVDTVTYDIVVDGDDRGRDGDGDAVSAVGAGDDEVAAGRGGQAWLLLDRQVRLGKKPDDVQRYIRSVRRITAAEGLELSPLHLKFNPAFETLRLHTLRVVRDGVASDRLARARIEVVRRELDADSRIYDGILDAVIVVDDLRVGDLVELEWSTVGLNPVFGGRYASSFGLGWGTPVGKARLRLVHPEERPVQLLTHLAAPPLERVVDGTVEHVWEQVAVPRVRPEGDTPQGVWEWPFADISEDLSWASVARWGVQLHTTPPPRDARLLAQIAAWRAEGGDPEAQVARALAFVQREIAYVGLELGESSHRPAAPDVVFSRRFGDCKDKAQLLVAMLRALDVEAWVAFVNTREGDGLDRVLPSQLAFNHVIVAVKLGDDLLWMDPTRAEETSQLRALDVGLKRALIVDNSTTALSVIAAPSPKHATTSVVERWRLTAAGAYIDIETTYRDGKADEMRRTFGDDSTVAHDKRYTSFYARSYPGIESSEPPSSTFAAATATTPSTFTIREHYTLDSAWQRDTDGRGESLELAAHSIDDLVWRPATRERTQPIGLSSPAFYEHRFEITSDEGWGFSDGVDTVDDSTAVLFTRRLAVHGKKLTLDHTFRVVRDEVPAAEVSAYLKSMDRVAALTTFSTWRPRADAPAVERAWNWPVALALSLWFAMVVGWVRRGWRAPNDGVEPAPLWRGGLVVVGLLVLVRPPVQLYSLWEEAANFELHEWVRLTTPGGEAYRAFWAPVLLGECMLTLAALAIYVLLAALFLGRRRSFPIAFLLASLFGAAEVTASRLLGLLAEEPTLAVGISRASAFVFGGAAIALLFAAVAVYLFAGKRPRAVFVR